jgi:hypothetical protein
LVDEDTVSLKPFWTGNINITARKEGALGLHEACEVERNSWKDTKPETYSWTLN